MSLIPFLIILQILQHAQESPNNKGSEFIPESVELVYYYFHIKIDIGRAESYIMSPNWIVDKKAAIRKIKKIINAFSGQ